MKKRIECIEQERVSEWVHRGRNDNSREDIVSTMKRNKWETFMLAYKCEQFPLSYNCLASVLPAHPTESVDWHA